jgi:hypothetical protein
MSIPPFSVVLVNYKTPEITRICLDLLREPARKLGFSVWVVDNNSADESTTYLRSLDWINFLERTPAADEPGFMGHGYALDMVLERANTDFLFLLHTDTFVYDPAVFGMMLNECRKMNVVAVGCLDQIYRGQLRNQWRVATRFLKYHARRLKIAVGLKSRPPKIYREQYIKSFCSLWDTKFIRAHGWTFSMDGMIPSYAIQDKVRETGHKIKYIPARKMFRYLDHIEAGTVAAIGGYSGQHRRTRKYLSLLSKYQEGANGTPGQ